MKRLIVFKSIFATYFAMGLLFCVNADNTPQQVAPTRVQPIVNNKVPKKTLSPAVKSNAPRKIDVRILQQSRNFNFPRRVQDDEDRNWNRYRELRDAWWQQREVVMRKIFQECPTQSFSAVDRQRAGCLGSDTLAQCDVKLARYCSAAETQHWEQIGTQLHDVASSLNMQIQSTIQVTASQNY